MEAFKVRKKRKVLDYRVGKNLDLRQVHEFFSKNYLVKKLWQEKRHVVGILEKDRKEYFLKLATTEGIGIRTTTEKTWNEQFNKYSTNPQFIVPKNFEDGYFEGLYYLTMDKFDGQFLCDVERESNLFDSNIGKIIDFSEHIQKLSLNIPINDAIQNSNHQEWFRLKTKSWLDALLKDVYKQFEIFILWKVVKEGAEDLLEKPRHGDFTPWHIFVLKNGALGLIDGEHAHSHGVENYDICYFIQRVFTVLDMPELAFKIFKQMLERDYDKAKLQTVLASRAIGGFLDQSFHQNPSYKKEKAFRNWVLSLN